MIDPSEDVSLLVGSVSALMVCQKSKFAFVFHKASRYLVRLLPQHFLSPHFCMNHEASLKMKRAPCHEEDEGCVGGLRLLLLIDWALN